MPESKNKFLNLAMVLADLFLTENETFVLHVFTEDFINYDISLNFFGDLHTVTNAI